MKSRLERLFVSKHTNDTQFSFTSTYTVNLTPPGRTPLIGRELHKALYAIVDDAYADAKRYKAEETAELKDRLAYLPVISRDYGVFHSHLESVSKKDFGCVVKPEVGKDPSLFLKMCDIIAAELTDMGASYVHWWDRGKARIAERLAGSVSSYKWASKW